MAPEATASPGASFAARLVWTCPVYGGATGWGQHPSKKPQVTALPGNPGVSLLFQKLETCSHMRSCVSVWGELDACSRSKQDIAVEEDLFRGPFLSQPQAGQCSGENGLAHSWPKISSNEASVSKDLHTHGRMTRYSRQRLRLFVTSQGEGRVTTRIKFLIQWQRVGRQI